MLRTPSPTGRTDAVVQYVGERVLDLGLDLKVTRRGLLNATMAGRRTPARPGGRRPRRHDRLHGRAGEGERPAAGHPARHAQRPVRRGRPRRSSTPTTRPAAARAGLHRHGPAAQGQRPQLRRRGRHAGRRLAAGRGADRRADRDQGADRGARHPGRRLRGARGQPGHHADAASSRAATSTTRPGIAAALGAFKALRDAAGDAAGQRPPARHHRRGGRPRRDPRPGHRRRRDGRRRQRRRRPAAAVPRGRRERRDARLDRARSTTTSAAACWRSPPSTASGTPATPSATTAPTPPAPSRRAWRSARRWSASASTPRHGHERTHLDGIEAVAELLALYLQTDLTFPEWDVDERGELSDFPSRSVQPTEFEERRDRRAGDRREAAP